MHSFNPTVVRLVRDPDGHIGIAVAKFQSHRGSISTLLTRIARALANPVSIPPWFD